MGLQSAEKEKYNFTRIAIEVCQLQNFYLHYKKIKLLKQLYSCSLQLEEKKQIIY